MAHAPSPRLDHATIEAALAVLPDWSREGETLVRSVRTTGWTSAIALVNAVADEAQRVDHHPDICVTGYRNVTLRLTSHDVAGISHRDLRMAATIDGLAGEHISSRKVSASELNAEP